MKKEPTKAPQRVYRPHDRSQRLLFQHSRPVRDLIRGFVREPWVRDLDFRTLKRLPSDFLSGMMPGEYEERLGDTIWKVRWKKKVQRRGQHVYVLVLVEFQSTCRQDMALRVLGYVFHVYMRLLKDRPLGKGGHLPIVLPLILYNGDEPWWAPVDVFDLVDEAPEDFASYVPSMRCIVIDEKRCPPEELEGLDENVMAAIIRAEQATTAPDFGDVVRDLGHWLKSPMYRELNRDFMAWFAKVPRRFPDVEIPELRDLLDLLNYVEDDMLTWTEQARVDGRQEGQAELVLRLIERKYGPVSEEVQARVLDADVDQLLAWTDRFVTAETLDEIFQDDEVPS